jgi:hypothetical protein
MSSPTRPKRGIAGIILAFALALFVAPAALAAPVNLATATPFVVLGATTVTNVGPSVLNGDLGLSPGTELEGFGLPAVVNGDIHVDDEVAALAQADLTAAYTVATEQAVLPANDLTGTDLGNRKLGPGTYRYTSDALLTGPLTLDAEGDPDAEFVFLIGSQLTTESASSVSLINGASACNVYWQVGSSADFGTTTAFQGNVMALTSISLKSGASVIGRMLARNGQVSLINNVLSVPLCAADSDDTSGSGTPESAAPAGGSAPAAGPGQRIAAPPKAVRTPTRNGRAVVRSVPRDACTEGFRVAVTGRKIDRVVFSLDGKAIGSRAGSPYAMSMRATPGAHDVRIRVTFTDSTRARTVTVPYRACAAELLKPRNGPSTFTG